MPIKSPRRIAAALWREAVVRRVPHGLMGLSYLRPRPGPAIALHRALWLDALPSWPRPLVAGIELILWLRWVLFEAWRGTWRAVRKHGESTRARTGVSPSRQALRLLGLALKFGIPPQQACMFGLEVPPNDGRDPALQYVFEQESAAWHRYVNAHDQGRDRAVMLLRDKSALAEQLSRAGISVVSTWATWSPGDAADFAAWLAAHVPDEATSWPGIFFKLRDGMASLGAFAAWRRGGTWQGKAIGGREVQGLGAIEQLWGNLTDRGVVIAQPRLLTHPALAALAGNDEAVTVRVITRRERGLSGALMAMVEAPLGQDDLHAVWPANAEDGAVQASTWDGRAANPMLLADAWTARRPDPALRIPDWDRLLRQSQAAHDAVDALAYIAWDWIVTPDGASLLEGNSGWRTTSPQRLFGPLEGPAIKTL